MPDDITFACYGIYSAPLERTYDPDVAAKEVRSLLDGYDGRVQTRGIYSLSGLNADADLMFWWIARSADDVQDLMVELRRTALGRDLAHVETFLGLVRPAEFTKDHAPAFIEGKEPKRYICVYPFVRTPDWYLLAPEERGRLLREHGEAGREYPDILANTTSAFGLGDYEWILCFEADGLDRIVDLIRRLRATKARRYTKEETPFFTGIRKDLKDAIADLP